MNKTSHYLSTSGLWLPLSFFIFIVYAVQRGFATIAKSGMVPAFFPHAMAIFFTTMSVSVLLAGFFLDRFSARQIIGIGSCICAIGMSFVDIDPYVFGILFGMGAAVFKIAPYSLPLKLNDDGNDGMRIAPQAAAKNIGGAAFLLFLGAYLSTFTLSSLSAHLGLMMIALGMISYVVLPDHKMTAWKVPDVITIMKKPDFWPFMIYFFVMCGTYYIAIMKLYPALIHSGMHKEPALGLLAISFIMAGIWRWPSAAFGKAIGYWRALTVGTIGMIGTIWLVDYMPKTALFYFAVFSAIHTPNYWALAKEKFGKEYLSTVIGLGFVAMYLGAGVMYGKW